MAEWLRQPTGDEDGRDRNGHTGLVRWVAAGPLTTQDAIEEGNFPIAFNDPHPDYGAQDTRRCASLRVVAQGFRVMALEARFSVPEDGTLHRDEEASESQPTVFSWATIQETPQIDRDRDDNPLVTSARRAMSGITQPRNYKRLTVTKWQQSYSVATSLEFENTVNSTEFEGAQPGEVKCSTIQPSQSYTSQSAMLPVDYIFDFKAISVWGEHPHQTQFIDQDSFARADGNTVRIVTATGEPVSDVPLDGEGRPLDTSLTYFENPEDEEPTDSPSWESLGTPTGATVVSAGDVVMLRYFTLPEKDHNTI